MGLFKRGETWWMRFSYKGKQIRRSTEATDKKLAERIHAKVLTEITEGKWFEVEARQHTFNEMADRFMKEYAPKRNQGTQRMYELSFRRLKPFVGGKTLAEISSNSINDYIQHRKEKGIAGATCNRDIAVLSKAFNLAIRTWKWCKHNPCTEIEREPEPVRFERCLSPEDEEKLLLYARLYLNGQLSDIIILALNTGMRLSEMLNLKWHDIDLFRKTLTVIKTKNKAVKTIPLNQTVFEMLKDKNKVVSMAGWVFSTGEGSKIMDRNLQREWYKVLKKAGIENFRFHDLRHTAASRMVQAGVDIYTVAKVLGHKTLAMTQRYAHHSVESLRAGVEALEKYNAIRHNEKASQKISTNLAQWRMISC